MVQCGIDRGATQPKTAGRAWPKMQRRSASRVVERRHDLAREQIDGAQYLGEREIAEGELPDEVVGAGLLHLRLDHARHSSGRTRDAAAAVLDLIEVRRPLSA